MKKKSLKKDFYREIKFTFNRFISIFLIVALGVAFFAGVRAAKPDMWLSADAFYDDTDMMDIRVIGTLGLTEDDVAAILKIEGVENVEGTYSIDVLTDEEEDQDVLEFLALSEKINRVTLSDGRMPQNKNECLVDSSMLRKGYSIGDTINICSGTDDDIEDSLNVTSYKIVGAGSLPYYLALDRGTSTIGTGTLSGFVLVLPECFSMEAYSQINITVSGAKDFLCYDSEYEDYVGTIVEKTEDISSERCDIRYSEIVDEANDKIDEANEDIEEAKKKVEDGERKIADGKKELLDAKKTIDDGFVQLENAKKELEEKEDEINKGRIELENQKNSLNINKEKLLSSKSQLEMALSYAIGDEQKQVILKQLEEVNTGLYQIEAGEKEIEGKTSELNEGARSLAEAKAQIEEKEAELNEGLAEYNAKKKDADQKIADSEKQIEDAKEEIAKGEEELEDAKDEVAKIEKPKWYVLDRNSLQTYVEYGQDSERIGAIGEVFPLIFFLVAALVSLTTMTRMVDEQRGQIGTLMALGYSRFDIEKKYILYALYASLSGSIFGLIIGQIILPWVIINAYRIMYINLPNVFTPLNLYYSVSSTIAAVLCTTLATYFACRKSFMSVPAELMRPEAPKAGKRILLERITFLWRRFTFTQKSTFRNLFRYKKRLFMTIFGIAGCMGLLVVGFGLKDSILSIGTLQYGGVNVYQSVFTVNKDADRDEYDKLIDELKGDNNVISCMEMYETSVDVSTDASTKSAYIVVPEDVEELGDYIRLRDRVTKEEYTLDDDSVVITEKLAKLLDVSVGDTICLNDGDTDKYDVSVSAICENYLMHYVYMSPEMYEKTYGKTIEYNEIYTRNDNTDEEFEENFADKYLKYDATGAVTFTSSSADRIADMLRSMDLVIYVLIIAAGMLAFVVLYNLNNINITERRRELATLKVLGFYNGEVATYVYRENIILTVIGIIFGIVFGKILHRFVILTAEIDMLMFARDISLKSYGYSVIFTIGFSVIVNFVMYYQLKRINMVESLKSIE